MEELRILHTADVHLGCSRKAFGERAAEHRRCIAQAFERCVEAAIARQVHLMLIAGEVFDRPRPGQRAVQSLLAELQRLEDASPPIEVAILRGTPGHEGFGAQSVWRLPELRELPAHVHLLAEEGPQRVEFPDLETLVQGRPWSDQIPRGELLAGVVRDPEFTFNVGLCHVSIERGDILEESGDEVVSCADIAATGVDYMALGHWHRPSEESECDELPAYYPGSPEIIEIDRHEPGQALFVTLRPGQPPIIEPVPTGSLRCESLAINVADLESESDLRERVEQLADQDLILDVQLSGLAELGLVCDVAALEAELAGRFFRLRITDASHPAVEEVEVGDFPEELVIGKFVRLAMQRIEEASDDDARRIAERALQTGLIALQTGEVP